MAGLASRAPCSVADRIYDHQDVVGKDATLQEIDDWIDSNFMYCADYHLALVTKDGQWSTERYPVLNTDRGDEGSETDRQRSVERIGIVLSLRKGPKLFQHPDPTVTDRFFLGGWGNLLAGTRRAWVADVSRSNRAVQLSVANGVPNCSVYMRKTPKYIAEHVIQCDNVANSATTMVGPIELWSCTRKAEPVWDARKKALGLTTGNTSVNVLHEMKLEAVNSCFPEGNRFSKYRHYEIAKCSIQRRSKHDYKKGPVEGQKHLAGAAGTHQSRG